MNKRKTAAFILTLSLCLSLFSACGDAKQYSGSSQASGTDNAQDSLSENSKSGNDTEVKMQTLLICDSLKNDSMKATFINSVSGATEDNGQMHISGRISGS